MLISAITGVRNIRAEMNVPMSKKAQMFIKTKEKDAFEKSEAIFLKLAGASGITVTDDMDLSVQDSVSVVSEGAEILIPLGDLVDFEKEIERLEKEKKRIRLSVCNTTELISREQLKHLFDRFYRTDSSRNSQTGGYGLGLSIAAATVEAHKGKIAASTEDEKSLMITVTLPAK